MANPLSLRLPEGTLERLASRATRAHVPTRTLAQRYIDEGLKHDEHPLVHFVDGPAGRRAALIGTGLDVWEAVAVIKDNDGDVHEAAAYLEIPVHLVQAAARYYGANREEIDAWIDANEAETRAAHEAWLAGEQAFRP